MKDRKEKNEFIEIVNKLFFFITHITTCGTTHFLNVLYFLNIHRIPLALLRPNVYFQSVRILDIRRSFRVPKLSTGKRI